MHIVKTLKKIFYGTQRARARIFSMKHVLMDVYQVCSNKSPGFKIGPAPGVIDFPYMCIAKTHKIFFGKKQIARVKILSMKYILVSVYKDCSNKSPGVKTAPAPGVSLF
jgi:hypothetical protein